MKLTARLCDYCEKEGVVELAIGTFYSESENKNMDFCEMHKYEAVQADTYRRFVSLGDVVDF